MYIRPFADEGPASVSAKNALAERRLFLPDAVQLGERPHIHPVAVEDRTAAEAVKAVARNLAQILSGLEDGGGTGVAAGEEFAPRERQARKCRSAQVELLLA